MFLYLFKIIHQSSRKRRITRIGTHVFSLGRMIFARREFSVRMFFFVCTQLTDKYTPGDQKSFDIIDRDTLFERRRRDYCPVSVDQSYDSDCSVAILTGD